MAKKQTFGDKVKKNQKKSEFEINFFGTSKTMVVKEIPQDDGSVVVIAKDDKGHYITSPSHVDSGLMDPNRSPGQRVTPSEEQLKSS